MSKRQIDIHINNLAGQAMHLGLMNDTDRLIYVPGSRTNGVSPEVWICRPKDDGTTRDEYVRPDFLPRFTLKHTAKDVELALESAYRALFAVTYKS